LTCGKQFANNNSLDTHYKMAHRGGLNPGNYKVPVMARTGRVKNVRGRTTFRLAPTIERPMGRAGKRLTRAQMAISGSLGKMSDLGRTLEGALWARRALHPCDETTGGGAPIPDLSQTESANIESRHFKNIGKELGGANDLWDCQFVVLPFVDAVVAYRQKVTSSTVWSYWHLVDLHSGVVKPGLEVIVNSDWSPQGTDNGRSVPTLLEQSTSFRQTFKGVTITQNSNSITNQGYVTASQWGAAAALENFVLRFKANNPEPPNMQCHVIRDIPDTPSDIVRNSPKAAAWPSKLGVYMPMRFDQNTHTYNQAAGNGYERPIDETNRLELNTYGYPIILEGLADALGEDDFFTQNGVIYEGTPTRDTDGNIQNGKFYTTAGSINQNIGVAIFTGIDPTANLEVKVRTGIEFIPVSGSMMSAFMSDAPLKDQVALDMVQATQTKLQPVYEASFNSAGTIVVAVLGAIAAVAPYIIPLFQKKKPRSKYTEEDVD
jgi:hypothetical protein